MPLFSTVPAAMTIAGSDSGGGAGIQADLKTFAAFGVYGTSAITAITAQNTVGVDGVVALSPEMVAAQMRSVLSDIQPRAAKTGMLANAEIVRSIAAVLDDFPDLPVVIDPVTIAKSGDALLAESAVGVLRQLLIPRCAVVTPNLPEAAALVGFQVESESEMLAAGLALLDAGAAAVVVKGGHRSDSADDLYIDSDRVEWLRASRIVTRCTHGTGCTFSAAIAAGLAHGQSTFGAVSAAKQYLTAAMRAGYEVGSGFSPVNHFHAFEAPMYAERNVQ